VIEELDAAVMRGEATGQTEDDFTFYDALAFQSTALKVEKLILSESIPQACLLNQPSNHLKPIQVYLDYIL
jgi:hypothetical protein